MRCNAVLQSIIDDINTKTGYKHLTVKSAVQTLCDGYAGAVGTYIPPQPESGLSSSVNNIMSMLEKIDIKTGTNNADLTAAVQTLCNGYVAQTPLYSVGVISDLHIQYETGVADLQRALTYLKDRVSFTCVCGDLVSFASADNMAAYKNVIDNYAGTMPVYECAGNHESYPSLGVGGDIDSALWTATTGKQLYYTINQGNDVFIFFSLKSERANDLFPSGALTWLGTTLESNKNKRCFVFMHAPEQNDKTADPSGSWSTITSGTSGAQFISLIKQYKNTVWFHGHTHVTLGVAQYPVSVNMGYRSVHIPSLVSPRFYDEETNTLQDYYYDEHGNKIWGSTLSEGYIMDIYTNRIVLKGIDFASGASKTEVSVMANEIYALDTTLVTI